MSFEKRPAGRRLSSTAEDIADELETLYSSLRNVNHDLGVIYAELTGKQPRSFGREVSRVRNERMLSDIERGRFRETLDIAYRDKRLNGPTIGQARVLEQQGIDPQVPGYESPANGVNPNGPAAPSVPGMPVAASSDPQALREHIDKLLNQLYQLEADAEGSWQQRFDAGLIDVEWDADSFVLLRPAELPRPVSTTEFHCISCRDYVDLPFGASRGLLAAYIGLCEPCYAHVVPPPIREHNLWLASRGRLGTAYGIEALREWWQQVLDATEDGEVAE